LTEAIGIEDISKIDFGETTKVGSDEVPVFWCCGVTGLEALKSANLDLAFTHSPGNMFITDILQDDGASSDVDISSVVVEYNSKNSGYSSLSRKTLEILNGIDSILQQDFGNRGIKHLVVPGDFAKAALALSHSSSVAMVTGFPVHDSNIPDETDGLPGNYVIVFLLNSQKAYSVRGRGEVCPVRSKGGCRSKLFCKSFEFFENCGMSI